MTWFTLSTPLTAHTLARAKNVNAIFTSVATSFARLMDSDLFRDRRIFLGTDTGAVNAYVVTLAPAPVAYVVGMTIDLLAANTNTGASTINVNGLGAKSILDSSGAAAGAGLIVANRITTLKYDGTAFRTAPTQTVVTPGDGTVTVAKLASPLSTMAANLSSSWNPATDDTTDLGQATHRWRNIFMAALAVINFNNGNFTLTHSAGVLTASGTFNANALGATGAMTSGTVSTGAITSGAITATGTISATGTITGNLFSGSGASLTSLPAGQLTGTVASARISGSYTGITAVGTLTSVVVTGGVNAGGNIVSSADITAGVNISASGSISATGSLSGASLSIPASGILNIGTWSATGATPGIRGLITGTDTGHLDFSVNSLNSKIIMSFYNANGAVGSVSIAGSGTTYSTSSDENLKDFIGIYDPFEAIRIIRADPVRDFYWKADGTYAVGWGAQTSYRISKDLAAPGHGKPGDVDYHPWGIDQGKRTPYLWAFAGYAIGVLDDHHNILTQHAGMLDDHETRIEVLEAENAALKAQLAKLTN